MEGASCFRMQSLRKQLEARPRQPLPDEGAAHDKKLQMNKSERRMGRYASVISFAVWNRYPRGLFGIAGVSKLSVAEAYPYGQVHG